MLKPAEGQVTIAILGGNSVIGRAIESLLASAGYAARYFSEYPEADAMPLGETRVALVLPALSSRRQEALITLIKTTPSTKNLPVIELITTPNENGENFRVPWPCSIEDLQRTVDEALLVSISARRFAPCQPAASLRSAAFSKSARACEC